MSEELRALFAGLGALAKVTDIETAAASNPVTLRMLLVARLKYIDGQVRKIKTQMSQERFR